MGTLRWEFFLLTASGYPGQKTESQEGKGRTKSMPSHVMLPTTKAEWKVDIKTGVHQRAGDWEPQSLTGSDFSFISLNPKSTMYRYLWAWDGRAQVDGWSPWPTGPLVESWPMKRPPHSLRLSPPWPPLAAVVLFWTEDDCLTSWLLGMGLPNWALLGLGPEVVGRKQFRKGLHKVGFSTTLNQARRTEDRKGGRHLGHRHL